MSGFSEATLSQKLSELNQTAPSIQGVSLWLLHHRKHYQNYVKVWYRELGKVKREQKLPMMYLANDLVQNSRKKYPEISKEFGTIMNAVFTHLVGLNFDGKTQKSINRLVSIWKERQSFEKKILSDINGVWDARQNKVDPEENEPVSKKRKVHHKEENKRVSNSTTITPDVDIGQTSNEILKILEIFKSTSDLDTSEELLSSLPDLSNISKTELSQEESSDKLGQLSEAENQLVEQTKIIEEEIESRTYLEQLMSNYILAQRKLVVKKKERLKNCKNKLQTIEDVKCVFESQLLDAALVDDELESIPMPES